MNRRCHLRKGLRMEAVKVSVAAFVPRHGGDGGQPPASQVPRAVRLKRAAKARSARGEQGGASRQPEEKAAELGPGPRYKASDIHLTFCLGPRGEELVLCASTWDRFDRAVVPGKGHVPRRYPVSIMVSVYTRKYKGGVGWSRVLLGVVGVDSVFDATHERLAGLVRDGLVRRAPELGRVKDDAMSRFEARYGERAARRMIGGSALRASGDDRYEADLEREVRGELARFARGSWKPEE